jgi:outer membrane lipopolysaccharide assembly protein LptE/RlpB
MKSKIAIILMALVVGLLTACSVSEQKQADGNKKVEVKVPFANIKVGTDTDAHDTGLSSYPGAQPKSDDNDKHRANVQIGGENFGVKVVAVTFVSDDPPEKVIDFYRKDLKKFGDKVLECPKGLTESHSSNDADKEIRCSDSGHTENGKLDLAVGVPSRQHVVSVKPNGKGTEFSLVYVNVKGGDKETM